MLHTLGILLLALIAMKVKRVVSVTDKRQFLDLPDYINQGDPSYIRPLDKDIEHVFRPDRNPKFKSGEAARWILMDDEGLVIGRIAAFVDSKQGAIQGLRVGGMGFFECIDSQKAANTLFDKARHWLVTREMEAMDGPINFGERDAWWGLLVDGFHQPAYRMNYNPPYYQALFENYGFKDYFQQYVYWFDATVEIPLKFRQKTQRILDNPDYTFKNADLKNLDKMGEDFMRIYNAAWSVFPDFKPLKKKDVNKLIRTLKPILVSHLLMFAYHQGNPVAFFLMVPDVNQIFKHFHGRLGIIEKLRFLYHLKVKGVSRITGLVFGVVPAHQRKGLEGAIIDMTAKGVHPLKKYTDLEMVWIGSFNPVMIHMVENLGAIRYKTLITYRYIFDPNHPFERAPDVLPTNLPARNV